MDDAEAVRQCLSGDRQAFRHLVNRYQARALHLEGWTYDELSGRLGIPRGTVMSRLFYARRRLQSLISGEES